MGQGAVGAYRARPWGQQWAWSSPSRPLSQHLGSTYCLLARSQMLGFSSEQDSCVGLAELSYRRGVGGDRHGPE